MDWISSSVVRLMLTFFCYRFSKVENGFDKFVCSKADDDLILLQVQQGRERI